MNLLFLNDAIKHYHCSAVLFPQHQPEVTTRLPQRTLQKKRDAGTKKANKALFHSDDYRNGIFKKL